MLWWTQNVWAKVMDKLLWDKARHECVNVSPVTLLNPPRNGELCIYSGLWSTFRPLHPHCVLCTV